MKLGRYQHNRIGVIQDDHVVDVTSVITEVAASRWPFPLGDVVVEHIDDIYNAALRNGGLRHPVDGIAFDSPIANPSKLVAAPVNYHAHHAEAQANLVISSSRPVLSIQDAGLFLKAASSLIGPAQGIDVQFPERRTDHELELVVVIGERCKNVPAADALFVVAGYCIGLDITVRGSEDRSFRKSIDTYSVLGPWLTTKDEIEDPDSLDMELRVNGEIRQSANTRQLIKGVRELIAWASEWYTLYPGDVIFTGTPEGVAPIAPGDVLTASIEKLGSMTIAVRAAGVPRRSLNTVLT
jgi:2-keto-4-pentenoate hydratase/2-oxohepta-3-ene-1,7-dioic acid hydratase in catechol pathway